MPMDYITVNLSFRAFDGLAMPSHFDHNPGGSPNMVDDIAGRTDSAPLDPRMRSTCRIVRSSKR